MYASNYFEELMLNLMRGQSIAAFSNLYLGLFLSNPGDNGQSGTEISYTGYERQLIVFDAPEASGNGMLLKNSAMITFPRAASSAGSVTHAAVFDSSQGGNMLLYGQLNVALNVQNGVSPVFRAGTVSWLWAGGLSPYYRVAIMNTLRGVACEGFTPYVALCNGNPTENGFEFSGNNYMRFPVTMSVPAQQSSGTAISQNTADIVSPTSSGTWGTLNTIAIADAASGGQYFAVGSLSTAFAVNSGYSVTIPAGNIQVNVN